MLSNDDLKIKMRLGTEDCNCRQEAAYELSKTLPSMKVPT